MTGFPCGRRVSIRAWVLASLPVILALTGCAFTSSLFGPRVLEKSKEQTPPWVSVKPSQLVWQESGYQYHAVQLDELDLPLGVKRAQLGATQLSEIAIVEAARAKVSEVCKIDANPDKGSAAEKIQGTVGASVKKQFGSAVRVADIYYEKVEAHDSGDEKIVRAGHVYNIHVLVTFPREQYEAALEAAAKTLKRESGMESRRCGDALAVLTGQPASR